MVTNVAVSKGYSEDYGWARRPRLTDIVVESKTKNFQICDAFVLVRAVIDDVVKVLCITVQERYSHSFDKDREVV